MARAGFPSNVQWLPSRSVGQSGCAPVLAYHLQLVAAAGAAIALAHSPRRRTPCSARPGIGLGRDYQTVWNRRKRLAKPMPHFIDATIAARVSILLPRSSFFDTSP